jgi:hypothetical protein
VRLSRRGAALLLSGAVALGVLVTVESGASAGPAHKGASALSLRSVPQAVKAELGRQVSVPVSAIGARSPQQAPRLAAALLPAAGLAPAPRAGQVHADGPTPDSHGMVGVYVKGADAAAERAIAAAGGTVTVRVPGLVQARVPASKLVALSNAPGVEQVRPPSVAMPEAVTAESVGATSADTWQAAQSAGAGVKVGIIDVGFAGLAAAQAAGEIPAGVTTFDQCHDPDTGASLFNNDDHGTAVTEIVHDMAPAASLFLVCINTSDEFVGAAETMRQQGVKVINASFTFSGIGRGDGSGDNSTPAGVVRRSRQAGILWSVSAGNEAQTHWSGTVRDTTPKNQLLDIAPNDDSQGVAIGAGSIAFISLQWDAWPLTHGDLDLIVTDDTGTPIATSRQNQMGTASGLPPVEEVGIENNSGADAVVFAFVEIRRSPGGVRYDLTAFGNTAVEHVNPASSIGEPASSPYVITAGAADVANNALEDFSGRGPTIDGRVKPDITGFDGVSTSTFGPANFFGTSASAPNVTGAAALIAGANPQLDASGIERELLSRARPATGGGNAVGHGLLTLTPTDVAPSRPGGFQYTPLATPARILDTRHGTGGRSTPLGAGEVFPLQVGGVAGVPAGAKAVVVNLTGVNATGNTDLSVFPTTFNGTSNLNLVKGLAAANLVTATLSSDGKIRVRNAGGTVSVIIDVVGYYQDAAGAGFSAPAAPVRVLDTRTTVGGHNGKLGAGQELTLAVRGVAGVPADASAVVLNLTGTQPTSVTDLSVYPQTFTGTSSLNLAAGATRANLVVATIGADGNIRIRNAGGEVHVIADLAGWFVPGSGARYVPLQPLRIMDTRTGNGLRHGAIGAQQVIALQAGEINTVPYDAAGVVLNVTGVSPTAATFLTLFPTGQPNPHTSNVNLAAGQVVPNSVYGSVGTNGQLNIFNAGGAIQVVVDISGYFTPSP